MIDYSFMCAEAVDVLCMIVSCVCHVSSSMCYVRQIKCLHSRDFLESQSARADYHNEAE